jgi:hypothetical protein
MDDSEIEAASRKSRMGTLLLPAEPLLHDADNTPQGMRALLKANERYRAMEWPEPFRRTTHRLCLGDARRLTYVADESAHLVVTSPPYWTLKEYRDTPGQMGHIDDYEEFLEALDRVWQECTRALVPGGRICCVVGDVCIPRKRFGKHYIMPLRARPSVHNRRQKAQASNSGGCRCAAAALGPGAPPPRRVPDSPVSGHQRPAVSLRMGCV